MLTCVEICAGAGDQALGLHMAGFQHVALIEYEQEYCDVLKKNMPEFETIMNLINGKRLKDISDLPLDLSI